MSTNGPIYFHAVPALLRTMLGVALALGGLSVQRSNHALRSRRRRRPDARPRPTATLEKVTAIQEKPWPAKFDITRAEPRSCQNGRSMSAATKGNPRVTGAFAAIAVHPDGLARQQYDPMPLDGDRSGLDVLAQLLRRPTGQDPVRRPDPLVVISGPCR